MDKANKKGISRLTPTQIAWMVKDIEKSKHSEFENKGYAAVSSFDTPIAKIVFFDTREEIGVFTEIMGITKEGEKAIQEMKTELGQ